MRVEVCWAPTEFQELRHLTSKTYEHLAPILSCFNSNAHTWVTEWKTDQMAVTADITPMGMSKFLSIRFETMAKEQCFYFSFRLHGTGVQFTHS